MTRACGDRPEVSRSALSRTRRPIGGSDDEVGLAGLVAGRVDVRLAGPVRGEAQGVRGSPPPRPPRSGRARAGWAGPAASALVQPAGRSAFERRSQVAPLPAYHCRSTWRAANSSYSRHSSRSTIRMWRSEPPSILGVAGIGYPTWSDSSS